MPHARCVRAGRYRTRVLATLRPDALLVVCDLWNRAPARASSLMEVSSLGLARSVWRGGAEAADPAHAGSGAIPMGIPSV